MDLPILEKLKDGVTFPFDTLIDSDNFEKTEAFWEWWWDERWKPGQISRPEIIDSDDEILVETVSKTVVDTLCHRESLDDPLYRLLNEGVFPTSDCLDRDLFRQHAMQTVAVGTSATPEPWIIFAGGGYGSGKTTILDHLAREGALPCRGKVGADMFKQLIPEYHLIKAVGDGRASYTVQKECIELVKALYPMLLEKRRSFILDSSMSDFAETTARVDLARKSGYKLMMVGVLTPLQLAIDQSMHRARISRRFPHQKALPESHAEFRKHLRKYLDLFDRILMYTNGGANGNVEKVGEQRIGEEFKILNPDSFNFPRK
jgi:predicted ABC-type ATPase